MWYFFSRNELNNDRFRSPVPMYLSHCGFSQAVAEELRHAGSEALANGRGYLGKVFAFREIRLDRVAHARRIVKELPAFGQQRLVRPLKDS
jgi:hypothetical protein